MLQNRKQREQVTRVESRLHHKTVAFSETDLNRSTPCPCRPHRLRGCGYLHFYKLPRFAPQGASSNRRIARPADPAHGKLPPRSAHSDSVRKQTHSASSTLPLRPVSSQNNARESGAEQDGVYVALTDLGRIPYCPPGNSQSAVLSKRYMLRTNPSRNQHAEVGTIGSIGLGATKSLTAPGKRLQAPIGQAL